MLIASFLIIAGLAFLTYGADRFVEGAAALAHNMGVSPLIIGLTIVGFATSAPEMLVAGAAALAGKTDISVGNAVGSNIANIGLVLGVTALITPLAVQSQIIKREYPIMFAAMGLAFFLLFDGDLSFVDGLILLTGMFLLIGMTVYLGKQSPSTPDSLEAEFADEIPLNMPTAIAIFWLVLGLALMLGGSQALISGAVTVAKSFGISDLVIGLTIVAIGTSLPELAASVMSALKNEVDIALGNIIGSNMFNMLGVLCIPGLIYPNAIQQDVLSRDFSFMFGLSVMLFFMSYGFKKTGKISRLNGFVLLLGFIIYQGMLFYTGTDQSISQVP